MKQEQEPKTPTLKLIVTKPKPATEEEAYWNFDAWAQRIRARTNRKRREKRL